MHTPIFTLRARFSAVRLVARAAVALLSLFCALFVLQGNALAQTPTRVWPPSDAPPPIVEPILPAQDASADAFSLARFASWTRFVFVSMRDGVPDVYIANGDGTNVQRVTNSPAVESRPSLHPEGNRIAFDADYNGDNLREIWMVNTDGSDLRQLVHAPGSNWAPVFSADWSHVAYTSNRNGNMDIYVMDLNSGAEYQVTSSKMNEFDAEWWPGANQLFFIRQIDEVNGTLSRSAWVASEGGYVEIGIGFNQAEHTSHLTRPRFSPDGARLAVSDTATMESDHRYLSVMEYNVEREGDMVWRYRAIATSEVGVDRIAGGYLPATSHFERYDTPLVTSYYWSDTTRQAQLVGTSIFAATPEGRVTVAASGLDIAGNWVSVDHEGPIIAAGPAPTWVPDEVPFNYSVMAIDGAGIDVYDLSYRVHGNDYWQHYFQKENVFQSGGNVDKRVRARDLAGNWSGWTPTHTFYGYSYMMSGWVLDVRGYPLANVAVGVGDNETNNIRNKTTDADGFFMERMDSYAYAVHYMHPYLLGYGEYTYARAKGDGENPYTSDPRVPNTWASMVLPLKGADIANGGFEPSDTISQTWRLAGGAYIDGHVLYLDRTAIYDGQQSLRMPTPAASATFTTTLPADLHAPTLSLAWKASEPTAIVKMVADITSSSGVTATLVLSPSDYLRDETWDWRHVWTGLDDFLGEQITVTLRAERPSAVAVVVDGVHISSWVTPLIQDVASVDAAAGAETDAAAPMLIHGENFAEPLKLYYGNGTQLKPLAVTLVDENTLRFTPPANLAPGNYRLLLANRAGTNAETYAEVAAGLRIGFQSMLPMVQWNK